MNDPTLLKPMLLHELERGVDGKPILPTTASWRMEPKLDGHVEARAQQRSPCN